MARRSRLAAALALALVSVSGTAVAHAAAAHASGSAAGTTFHVNNTVSHCSDSGAGTSSAPLCTVQAAFDTVTAGDTVEIVAGTYAIPATLAASGTAAAPITVWFGTPGAAISAGTTPVLESTTGSAPALTLSGASYIDIHNADVLARVPTAVSVTDSSHVTFGGGQIQATGTGVDVSGSSSDVTLERATSPRTAPPCRSAAARPAP